MTARKFSSFGHRLEHLNTPVYSDGRCCRVNCLAFPEFAATMRVYTNRDRSRTTERRSLVCVACALRFCERYGVPFTVPPQDARVSALVARLEAATAYRQHLNTLQQPRDCGTQTIEWADKRVKQIEDHVAAVRGGWA